jgi:hypothetical protein
LTDFCGTVEPLAGYEDSGVVGCLWDRQLGWGDPGLVMGSESLQLSLIGWAVVGGGTGDTLREWNGASGGYAYGDARSGFGKVI